MTTILYHDARWDGVRQAVWAGATVGKIAFALGVAMDEVRDLVHRIEERGRELQQYRERQTAAGT